MGIDPFFQLTESMRTLRRDGSFFVLALETTTSPENFAPCGTTVRLSKVAIASRASTFVPLGVFPEVTLFLKITGNS